MGRVSQKALETDALFHRLVDENFPHLRLVSKRKCLIVECNDDDEEEDDEGRFLYRIERHWRRGGYRYGKCLSRAPVYAMFIYDCMEGFNSYAEKRKELRIALRQKRQKRQKRQEQVVVVDEELLLRTWGWGVFNISNTTMGSWTVV